MASEKISQLPVTTTSTNGDLYTLVQGGVNKSITFTALQAAIALTPSSGITQLTGDVSAIGPGVSAATVNSVGGQIASAIAAATVAANAATFLDTPSTIVARDASGNFSAGTVTASLVGNVTGNVSGSSSSFTGALGGDVTGTQSATVILSTVVTAKLLTNYVTGTNTVIGPSDSILGAFEKLQAQITGSVSLGITALTGDVSAMGPGSATATVNSVGGQSASTVAAATVIVDAATPTNTVSTLVKRDASGNFSAGIIDATFAGSLTGNVTGNLTGNVTGNVSGSSSTFTGTLSGDVTGTQGATVVSFVGGQSAAAVNTSVLATESATNSNVFSTIVKRDSAGDFSATTIISALIGNVTGNVTGNVSGSAGSFTGSLSGDITGTQNATVVSTVGGESAAAVAASVLATQNATNLDTASTLVKRDSGGNFSAGTITANLNGSATSFTGSLSGDITGTQSSTLVSAIHSTSVTGTTGTGNVMFSISPTTTGVLTAAAANFSGAVDIASSSLTAFEVGPNTLIVDTINGAIGINTTPSTTAVIDVVNNSGATKAIQLTGYGSNVGLRGRYANGTSTFPSAATAGNILEFISGRGYGSSQFATNATGVINIIAGETFTNSTNATYITFAVTPTGSVTNAEAVRINSTGNLLIGTTTDDGTDKLQVSGSVSISGNAKIGTTTSSAVTIGETGSTAIQQINGGIQYTTNTVTSNYTVDSITTDYTIYPNSTSSVITITLPPPTRGRVLQIYDFFGNAATNNITIRPHASETINGLTQQIIAANYGGATITSDGTNWFANKIPTSGFLFVSSGTTYTTPLNVTPQTRFKFTLIGGGAGGSSANVAADHGTGGGGGGGLITFVNGLSANTSYNIAIGAAGSGGSAGFVGGTGGNTTLTIGATTYTAGGGLAAATITGNGGGGGTSSPATGNEVINVSGQNGGGSATVATASGGEGGSSAWAYGLGGASLGTAGNGNNASGYGGGGGGTFGSGSPTGGNGTQGCILVEWAN